VIEWFKGICQELDIPWRITRIISAASAMVITLTCKTLTKPRKSVTSKKNKGSFGVLTATSSQCNEGELLWKR
jgi:hypothetical protein